jgi:hypothetical protein
MEINRQNYEIYLLDYIEGNLPDNMVIALKTFLKNNPDIDNEAKELQENILIPDVVLFDRKEKLKKNLATDIHGVSRFEQLSVSFLENEISPVELIALNKFFEKDEQKRKEHQLIQETKFIANKSLIFRDKNKLKHISVNSWFSKNKKHLSIAASIAVLLSLLFLLNQENKNDLGKAISFKNHDFKLRIPIEYQTVSSNLNTTKITPEIIISPPDSVIIREKYHLNAIENKSYAQIEIPENNEKLIFADISKMYQATPGYSDNAEYKTIKKLLNEKFKEKVLKQDKNAKVTFISVVNAFGRLSKKVFNRKIEMEKITNEDGTHLYAIKTDAYNLYTVRSPKDKQKTEADDKPEIPKKNN